MKQFLFLLLAIPLLTAFALKPNGNGRSYSIELSGAQEAPGPGDPDGSGHAELILNQGQGTITYHITVDNIAPATAAHIHFGEAGEPGPVVVPLHVMDGMISGVVTVDKELIKAIRQNPDAY